MKYFIDINYVKKNTIINSNVNDNDISPLMKVVAEMNIQPILGNILYNDLLTKYNNASVLTPSEKEQLSLIQPVMGWGVCYEVILNTAMTVTAKGPQNLNGDNSTNVDFQEMGHLRKTVLSKRNFYMQNLVDYFCKNDINHDKCLCGTKINKIGMFIV